MAVCGHCGAEIPRDARFCPSCGAPVANERPTEERKLATVLFADLVGSTALAGSEDPERTRVLLDRFSGAMADEIERAGGTIEKFVGDAVMAAFGAPNALEDHAERALHERGDLVATFNEQQTQRRGMGSWSRTPWLLLIGVLVAIAVAIVLIVVYTGGGSGGGGGGGY
jgi:class 3 adenylate cyclase